MPHMAPPHEHFREVEDRRRQAAFAVIDAHAPHGDPGHALEVRGDRVAETILVRLLLGRLPFVPHDHANRLR